MKKINLSTAEKKMIRKAAVFALIQVLIVCFFIRFLNTSKPIDLADIKYVNITVDDAYLVNMSHKETWLIIVSQSTKYVFEHHTFYDEYSVYELHEEISKGDYLSLSYYDEYTLLGKTNLIVELQNETKRYRSLEEYNRSKDGLPIASIILFIVAEFLLVGVEILYVCINYNVIIYFYRKIKKKEQF